MSGLACRRYFDDAVRVGRASSPHPFCIIPGGHARGGFSFLGAEIGVLDRLSPVGVPQGRIGVSGMFFEPGTLVKHPDAVRVRYFVGAQVYPGGHFGLVRPQPSLSLEGTLRSASGPHVIGGDLFLGEEARALVLRYRAPAFAW